MGVLALFLAACQNEKVDEGLFREKVAGAWVQADNYSASPYWEFTTEGKVLDVFGKEIGSYESVGDTDHIHVKAGGVDFTSSFIISRKRTNISFTDTRYRPFLKATSDLKDRALYEIHQPLILENLRKLVYAAREHRRLTGTSSVTYADLVGPGKVIPAIQAVAGEDYSGLVFTGESKIKVKTEYSMEVLEQE